MKRNNTHDLYSILNGCSTLEKLFRIDCFLPFKLRLLLLSFAAINAKYINLKHREQLVRTEAKIEGNLSRELVNRESKTENFREFC